MAFKAARTADSSIWDIIVQQRWRWMRIHNISLTRYMGRERDRGLRRLHEELEAGFISQLRSGGWGGAKVRDRFQERKEGSSSVVAAVLGEVTFSRLCRCGAGSSESNTTSTHTRRRDQMPSAAGAVVGVNRPTLRSRSTQMLHLREGS